jgi:TolA-binding protein
MICAFFSFVWPVNAEDLSWVDNSIIEKARLAVVVIERVGMNDTVPGFFASPDGLVVALAQDLAGVQKVIIHTTKGEKIIQSSLAALDEVHDLAVFATGQKPPSYLKVSEKPRTVGERCALVFPLGMEQIKAADAKLLSRRVTLDRTGVRFIDSWSFALSLNSAARTGSPLVTREGDIAGIFFQFKAVDPTTRQRLAFAHPESTISAVLAKAHQSGKLLTFPQTSGIANDLTASSDPTFTEGIKLMQQGDQVGAAEKFRISLSRHPKSPWVREQLIGCLHDSGDIEGAHQLIEESIRMFPGRPSFQSALGMILGQKGDLNSALAHFKAFTNAMPQHADAWKGLGDVFLMSGRISEAGNAYRTWSQLEPDSILAWRALSQAGTPAEKSQAIATYNELESLYFSLRYTAPHRD